MKGKSLLNGALIGFSLSLLFCWGCASSPSARFYTLSPPSGPVKTKAGQPLSQGPTIGLGPVSFPDYLNRSGIVTRSGGNTIEIAEFDLWAGSLKEDFTRALAAGLAQFLETDKIALYPYGGSITIDYRILPTINRFEGTAGDRVILEAMWVILAGPEKKDGIVQKSVITEAVSGSAYPSLVAAQSRAVEHLSREIAQAIKALPPSAATK